MNQDFWSSAMLRHFRAPACARLSDARRYDQNTSSPYAFGPAQAVNEVLLWRSVELGGAPRSESTTVHREHPS